MKKQFTLLALVFGVSLMAAPAAAKKTAAPKKAPVVKKAVPVKDLPAALAKVPAGKLIVLDYTNISGKKEKDPGAFKGQAGVFTATAKRHYKGFINSGVYDQAVKKNLLYNRLPVTAQDGKYHWYKVGKVKTGKKSILYIADWWVSASLYKYSDAGYEVWIHVKAVGPDYIKNAKGASKLLMDRIILVKQN